MSRNRMCGLSPGLKMPIMNLYATCLNLVQPSLHRRNQIKVGSKKWQEEKKGGKPIGLVLEMIYDVFVLDGLVLVPHARLRRLMVFIFLLCRSRLQIFHGPSHSSLLKMKS